MMISITSPGLFEREGARTVVAGSTGSGGSVLKSDAGALEGEPLLSAPLSGFEESLTQATLGKDARARQQRRD
jgi:hypothetical protein